MYGVELVESIGHLLREADHIVIAAPATQATYHLLDDEAFQAAKPGAHLINVARGSLVDHDALLRALDDGRIARASLDVVDPEPLPTGHRLYRHPRVRLSPHVAWSSPSTTAFAVNMFVSELRRWRAGEPLQLTVDVDAGY
jgi:phosphoglycerate dehydrogenase-like enzyme